MGYGILQSYGFYSGNQVGGRENPWVITGYGVSQVWFKTEWTVLYSAQYLRMVPHEVGRRRKGEKT